MSRVVKVRAKAKALERATDELRALADPTMPYHRAMAWAADRLMELAPGRDEAEYFRKIRETVRTRIDKMLASKNPDVEKTAVRLAVRLLDMQTAREQAAFGYAAAAAEGLSQIEVMSMQVGIYKQQEQDERQPQSVADVVKGTAP